MRIFLPAFLFFFSVITCVASVQSPLVPTITTDFSGDDPLTKISLPWSEPSSAFGSEVDPDEKITVKLRGMAFTYQDGRNYLTNAGKTIVVVNLKYATKTCFAFVFLKDIHGYIHMFNITKQVLSLFPKSFLFPAEDYLNVYGVVGNHLKMHSKDDTGHYSCDFEVAVQPSGAMRLIRYKTEHTP